MSTLKSIRFTDRKDIIGDGRDDFVIRRRTTVEQIRTLFLMGITILVGISVIVYNDSKLGAIICLVVGIIMLVVAKKFEKLREHIHISEFMNALFTSALANGYKMTMVVKPGGEIIYIDRGFQLVFPDFLEQPDLTLNALFGIYPTDDATKTKILHSLVEGGPAKMDVSIASGLDKAQVKLALSIEPIARPSGFIMIRAKAA
jgi:hypothetical protein